MAFSVATGNVWSDSIVWAARGTYAREAGIQPHLRDGWYLALESISPIVPPVLLENIRLQTVNMSTSATELERKVGSPIYYPFERGESRPIRPLQGYLFKLPKFFVELFPALQNATTSSIDIAVAESQPSYGGLGTAYRSADEDTSVAERDPFSLDPSLVERGSRAHARTQNLLAAYLTQSGIEPRSPTPAEPNFDLAWESEGRVWVAEVKSLTALNEEKQLRLGLGQVLRCRYWLSKALQRTVTGVLVTEREPSDPSWGTLCSEIGVALVYPEDFSRIGIK